MLSKPRAPKPTPRPTVDLTPTWRPLTVTEDAKGPAMMINLGEHGSFPAGSIKFSASSFEFIFSPGPVVSCVLLKAEDGSYAGNCTDDGGDAARLVVTPPKQQG